MAKTVSLKLKSRDNLVAFLKRFTPLQKYLLLELTPKFLICKTNTDDRSTLKYSKLALDNILEGTIPGDIRIPIADATKIEKLLKRFGSADEIFVDIAYEESSEGYFIAHPTITFKTDKLKIKLPCGDSSLVTFVSPDTLKHLVKAGSDSKEIDVPFKKEYFDEIQSLCDIDIEKEKLQFAVDTRGQFRVSGSNFDLDLDVLPAPANDVRFRIKTNQFEYIEPEISSFEIGPNYLVVRSKESDTITLMSNIED